jgi:hypothetical protein
MNVMKTLKSNWESEKPVPDDGQLKEQWEAELKILRASIAQEDESSKRKMANREPLIKVSKFDPDAQAKESKRISKESFRRAEAMIAKPPMDIEALHNKDLDLAKSIARLKEGPGNPSWWGYIWSAGYGGSWSSCNGESEEVPSVTFTTLNNRFDPRTQAWGEGWFDGDYSELHGYLAFTFNPPSWGHLHLYVYPWFHGYYSLYSDDEWYNSEYARAEVDSWLDLYQNFWRGRSYIRRFTLAGDEIHPTRYGRFDTNYSHYYFTDVGQGDLTTIRVGIRIYSYARASGSHSILNFQAGTGNYILVPYVYWYLHH